MDIRGTRRRILTFNAGLNEWHNCGGVGHESAESEPALCEKAAKILLDWQDDMMKKSLYQSDPLWIVMKEGGPYHVHGKFDEFLERLQKDARREKIPQWKEMYGETG